MISGGDASNVDTKDSGAILNLRRSPGLDEVKKTKKTPIRNNQSPDPGVNPKNNNVKVKPSLPKP